MQETCTYGSVRAAGAKALRGYSVVEERKFIELWRQIYFLSDYSDEETTVFTKGLIQHEDEGHSLFAVRRRLRTVRRRRKENGRPYGRFARAPRERPKAMTTASAVDIVSIPARPELTSNARSEPRDLRSP